MSKLYYSDAMACYDEWPSPHVIISDGPYGLGLYPGETRDAKTLADFYRPHARAWAAAATPQTTLWFWNSERGWAESHQVLRDAGWVYRETVVWDKGKAHLAGKVNSLTIKGLPVVTELCVRYSREPMVDVNVHFRDWLRAEWQRSGLPMVLANIACGVKSAASRKWLTSDHLWYAPDDDAIAALGRYCDLHGDPEGRPYFDLEGRSVSCLQPRWNHQHGISNVWVEPSVRGQERVRRNGKTLHPNQKPLSLMARVIQLSSHIGDVVWEPFGGLFTGCVAAKELGRSYFGAEVIEDFYKEGRIRVEESLYSQ